MINEIFPQASTDDINNALSSSNGNIEQAVKQLLPVNGSILLILYYVQCCMPIKET